jgi:hypothetical protein
MSYKGSRSGGKSAIVKSQWSFTLDFVNDSGKLARHLHSRLGCINGHEKNAKARGRRRGCHGLYTYGQVARRIIVIHQRQDSCIGSRITEPRQWTLNQCRQYATVEARNAAVGV